MTATSVTATTGDTATGLVPMDEVYDGLMDVRTPVDLDLSSDARLLSVITMRRGDQVVPRLERPGDPMPGLREDGQVCIVDTATGQILYEWEWPDRAWTARWVPGLAELVVVAELNGEVGLWVASTDGHDPRLLVGPLASPLGPIIAGWDHTGRVVVLTDNDTGSRTGTPNGAGDLGGVRVDHLVNLPGKGPNAGAETAAGVRDLIAIDVSTGQRHVIGAGLNCRSAVVSPDGRAVVTMGNPSRIEMSSFATTRDVEVRAIETGDVIASLRNLTAAHYIVPDPVWNPGSDAVSLVRDGAVVLLGTDGQTREIAHSTPLRGTPHDGSSPGATPVWSEDGSVLVVRDEQDALWALDPASGRLTSIELPPRTVDPHLPVGPGGTLLSDQPGRFLAVVIEPESFTRKLWQLSLNGGAPEPVVVDEKHLPIPLHPKGATMVGWRDGTGARCYHAGDAAGMPPEVRILTGDGRVQALTSLNRHLGSETGTVIKFAVEIEGARYTALLQLPSGASPQDGPFPLVVDAYPGGPRWGELADRWWYLHIVPPQLITARGWASLSIGTMGARDADTRAQLVAPILACLDRLVADGIADDRVVILGQSAGSYLVNCLITVTDRFRAAVSFNGMANLASHFGQLYVSPDGPLMHGTANAEVIGGGPPWEQPDRYVEKSPLFHLDHVNTPVLVVHGTGDMAAMVQGGDEMFVGLRRLDKHVEILRYHGEGHGPGHYTEPNRRHMYDYVLAFFAKHLEASA